MKFSAIIVAAGSSMRMGFDKLLADLSGKPVLQHSIETFLSCDNLVELVIVSPEERFSQLSLDFTDKKVHCVDGGNDRHDSVAAGLAALSEDADFIAVHDGARPLITQEQILQVLDVCQQFGAAASARPVTETVKKADSEDFVSAPVSREDLWLMETPQIFRTDLLTKSYSEVAASGARVTDEVSAMELINQPVKLVKNSTANPKITYPGDITQAERLIFH